MCLGFVREFHCYKADVVKRLNVFFSEHNQCSIGYVHILII